MQKEIICTVCPRGCHIMVTGNEKEVQSLEGYGCKRGIEYATAEFISPVRILTTTVKIDGNDSDLLPVRSNKPISKSKILDCMEFIKKTSVKLPIKQSDIIISDICGSGADIIATKEILAEE